MKRKLIIAALVICVCIVVGIATAFFVFKGAEFVVALEKEQIQEAIDKKMPYEKSLAFIFKLQARNTTVLLESGSNRIGASTDVLLNMKLNDNDKNLGGYVRSDTGIRYDQKDFCFYLINPVVQELKIQGIPEKYTAVVTGSAKKLLEHYLLDIPVYKINDKNLKLKLAKAVLKKVDVVDGKLVLTLGY